MFKFVVIPKRLCLGSREFARERGKLPFPIRAANKGKGGMRKARLTVKCVFYEILTVHYFGQDFVPLEQKPHTQRGLAACIHAKIYKLFCNTVMIAYTKTTF